MVVDNLHWSKSLISLEFWVDWQIGAKSSLSPWHGYVRMLEHQQVSSSPSTALDPLVLEQRNLQCCHVCLPDTSKPTSAIAYDGHFYCYVRFFSTLEAAQRGMERLQTRGNQVILTKVLKGFVLWVLEPDAQLAIKEISTKQYTCRRVPLEKHGAP